MIVGDIIDIVIPCTDVFRKGEVVTNYTVENSRGGVVAEVTEINAYPHADEYDGPLVDMVFVEVGVNLHNANPLRDHLIKAIGDGIGGESGVDYHNRASYISIGADLGDQEMALRFMALCSVLHIGELITPMSMGFEGDTALTMAGVGLLYLELLA